MPTSALPGTGIADFGIVFGSRPRIAPFGGLTQPPGGNRIVRREGWGPGRRRGSWAGRSSAPAISPRAAQAPRDGVTPCVAVRPALAAGCWRERPQPGRAPAA